MVSISDGGLRLALERLKWALSQPMRQSADDWDGRLRRALAALDDAWGQHAVAARASFTQVVDPAGLPFTPLSQHAGALCQDHNDFLGDVRSLQDELASVAALDPASFSHDDDPSAASFSDPERGPQRLARIHRRVTGLVSAMEYHLATERVLLEAEQTTR